MNDQRLQSFMQQVKRNPDDQNQQLDHNQSQLYQLNQGLNPGPASMFLPGASTSMNYNSMSNPMAAAAMLPGGSGVSNDSQLSTLGISNEIKRLQQLHQLNSGQSNSLMGMQSQLQMASTPNSILQNYLDQKAQNYLDQKAQNYLDQKAQNYLDQKAHNFLDHKVKSSRLEDPLRKNFLLDSSRSLLMNQQLAVNVPRIPSRVAQEVPLPSPHSLFHRDGSRRMRGGVIEPFPEKLHRLLCEVEASGRSDVISFVANGRAFSIHKPDKFFKEIVPLYFRQSRLSSFKRQLNLYGFELINTGPARGGYYHELFVKDHPELCRRMRRVAVKVMSKKDDPDKADADDEEYGEHDERVDKPFKGFTKVEEHPFAGKQIEGAL